ncbi:MAG: M23 family metallopeptidase [Gemmatimonadales bacterium]
MSGSTVVLRALAALALSAPVPLSAQQLEIRVHPGDSLFTYPAGPSPAMRSLLVQAIAVVNTGTEPCEVLSVTVDALANGDVIYSAVGPPARLNLVARALKAYETRGMLDLYDFQFQTGRLLGPEGKLASSTRLGPGEAIVITGTPMLVTARERELRISATGKADDGRELTARKDLRLAGPASGAVLDFPLRGLWYVYAGPDMHAHHRWAAAQEFAFDLVVLGPDGRTYSGDGRRSSDYHAYGRPVLAAGDGEVAEVATSAVEDEGRFRQEGESADDFRQRSARAETALLQSDKKAAAGNYVIIRHEDGLYSGYMHLQGGSVTVAKGDRVSRGQMIGRVGQTGNSTEPHLHFHVTDAPDPLYARGIPVRFRDAEAVPSGYTDRFLHTGWLARSRDSTR